MRRPFALAYAFAFAALPLLLASCGGGTKAYTTQPPITGGELGSTALTPGTGNYAHTFNTAGTFRYKCTIHPTCTTLQGKVTVVAAATPIQPADDVSAITFSGGSAGDPYGAGATCSALSNTADSVHVGDTVTWTNTSPLPHTVTSY